MDLWSSGRAIPDLLRGERDAQGIRGQRYTADGGTAGATVFQFTISRAFATAGSTTVDFQVSGSSASPAGVADFVGGTFPSDTVVFEDGESAKTIDIEVQGDIQVEPNEVFTLTLTSSSNAKIDGDNDSASGTILNDDAPGQIEATKTVLDVGREGETVTYEISLTNNGAGAVLDSIGSNEFEDILPAELSLLGATSDTPSFAVIANIGANTVTGNGSIAAGATVTVIVEAHILAASGTPVSNQGTVNYDADRDGTPDTVVPTDDPAQPGNADATVFSVEPELLEIPTNTQTGLLLLIALLGVAGAWRMRS